MPLLEDIDLYSLTHTMRLLDQLYEQDADIYEDFLRELCAEFALGREYMLAIQEMAQHEAPTDAMHQADRTLKHLLALWILHKEIHIPLSGVQRH